MQSSSSSKPPDSFGFSSVVSLVCGFLGPTAVKLACHVPPSLAAAKFLLFRHVFLRRRHNGVTPYPGAQRSQKLLKIIGSYPQWGNAKPTKVEHVEESTAGPSWFQFQPQNNWQMNSLGPRLLCRSHLEVQKSRSWRQMQPDKPTRI